MNELDYFLLNWIGFPYVFTALRGKMQSNILHHLKASTTHMHVAFHLVISLDNHLYLHIHQSIYLSIYIYLYTIYHSLST